MSGHFWWVNQSYTRMQIVPSHLSSSFLPPLPQERTRIFLQWKGICISTFRYSFNFAVSESVDNFDSGAV